MIIRPCDVETTSLESSAEVVEIGYYDIIAPGTMEVDGRRTFVKPAAPIPATASAVHHITNADVVDAPAWNTAWRMLVESQNDGDELVFAAHMASYERQFLDGLIKARWICTWKVALRLWPMLESHSLQAIRYALKLPVDPALASPPHRALPDAYLCGILLLEMMKIVPVDTMIEWSTEPAVYTKFDFGKYNGMPLSAADEGFLQWMLGKDFSDDWKWNVNRELQRRAAAAKNKYVEAAIAAVPKSATVQDLGNWWFAQADEWAKHGILPGTEQYEAIKAACSTHKAQLLAGEQPQFGGASA